MNQGNKVPALTPNIYLLIWKTPKNIALKEFILFSIGDSNSEDWSIDILILVETQQQIL